MLSYLIPCCIILCIFVNGFRSFRLVKSNQLKMSAAWFTQVSWEGLVCVCVCACARVHAGVCARVHACVLVHVGVCMFAPACAC